MFGANIRYLEYEPETEKYGGDIYRKWGDAVQHVETEYSLSCTDKEFLIPSTVNDSITYLDNNSDYSIADGCYYIIESKKVIYQWQGSESLKYNNPHERVLGALQTNVPYGTQFALNRTSNYKGFQ